MRYWQSISIPLGFYDRHKSKLQRLLSPSFDGKHKYPAVVVKKGAAKACKPSHSALTDIPADTCIIIYPDMLCRMQIAEDPNDCPIVGLPDPNRVMTVCTTHVLC